MICVFVVQADPLTKSPGRVPLSIGKGRSNADFMPIVDQVLREFFCRLRKATSGGRNKGVVAEKREVRVERKREL